MSMRINIENILKSKRSIFEDIVNKLHAPALSNAKKELSFHSPLDQILFDAINLTLKKLHEEENFVSRLLYRSFGIGREKNKRREQLIILGSQLKSQFIQEKQYNNNIHKYKEQLNSSKKNLTRLRNALKNKITFISSPLLQERCNSYIQQINEKNSEIFRIEKELDLAIIESKENSKFYKKLLRKIPRYHELHEKNYMALIE